MPRPMPSRLSPLPRLLCSALLRSATQVGEFYEAVGIDAVLLVQHAGLNPMASGAGRPPRAGCPRQNLRRTVADLVAAGLSVVVCEEVSGTRGASLARAGGGGARY